MASPNQWTWVWVNSGSWWWAGRPGMLRSMGLQRVGATVAKTTEQLNWGIYKNRLSYSLIENITGCIFFKVNKTNCRLSEDMFHINEVSFLLNFYEDRIRVINREKNLVRIIFYFLNIFLYFKREREIH